ncbi:DNA primase [Vibrio phage K436]
MALPFKRYLPKWLDLAKKLRVGTHSRIDCPRCGWGTNTKAAIINHNMKDYSVVCNACKLVVKESKGRMSLADIRQMKEAAELASVPLKMALPDDCTLELPEVARAWLYKCGISPSYWKQLQIGWSEKYQRVVLPVFNHERVLVWYQLRAVHEGQKPKYIQPKASKDVAYTVHGNKRATTAVVVEDIASAMRLNLLPLNIHAYSIMGTALTPQQLRILSGYQHVLSWFDPDKAGIDACRKIRRALSLWTTVHRIKSTVDPKKLSNQQLTFHILSRR